ncbi:MAG: efflux RND transporter permease subunit, partial [Desulfobacteraceae bacterium]|jgi:hypothetical protein
MKEVMQRLFTPILFTSLTTAAGFLSFLTTSIPPARLFGLFVAVGVMIAWLVTIFLVPAYVMIVPKRMLANFGKSGSDELDKNWLSRFLQRMGNFSYTHSKSIIVAMALIIVLAIWGVTNINVNDNYAKRFTLGHPIRQADMALNKHFGGTYTAFLNLGIGKGAEYLQKNISDIESSFAEFATSIEGDGRQVEKVISDINVALAANRPRSSSTLQYLDKIIEHVSDKAKDAPDEEYYILQEIQGFFELEKEKQKIFKRPDVLKYMVGLQKCLEKSGLVGKTTSVADVIRKVNQELVDGRPENYRIPGKLRAVSECYMQYQGSHRPNDLWHLVTPDFMQANIRVQFTKGDSKQTEKTVKAVDSYIKAYKPPVVLSHSWSGLHYVNYIFQDKMFWEMLGSFASAFVIIFITMIILFRSFKWALICMIPLSFTIVTVYGATGIIGVDYDMPVAVMSAITLGMAVDFAIHLLERSRNIYREAGNWALAVPRLFGEPALAISRNVLVLALGFLPLMVAHLVPYKTTALMLFGIILFSGITTLLFLPAVLHIFEKVFFKETEL